MTLAPGAALPPKASAYWVALTVTILFGAYLRLDDLGEPSLWHDEIYHVLIGEKTLGEPALHWLVGLESDRENGPLYYATQLLANRFVGGEIGVRIVPAFVGIATLPLMALAGFLISGRLVSLVATLFLAVSPLHVYFSREGRPYAAVMFLACMMLVVLLRPRWRWSAPAAYLTCVTAAYTGAMSAPLLAAFGAIAGIQLLGWLWKGRRGGLTAEETALRRISFHFVIAAAVGVALISLLYIDFEAAPQYAPDFSKPPSKLVTNSLSIRAVKKFVASMSTSGVTWISMQRRSVWFFVLAGLGLCAGLWQRRRATTLTIAMFLLPTLASFAALIAMGRFYGVRYTCSGHTAFILLVGLGVVAVARFFVRVIPTTAGSGRLRPLAALALALTISVLVARPNVEASRSQPYEKLDWRGLANFLHDTAIDGETIVAANRWPYICLNYYLEQMPRRLQIVDASRSVDLARSMAARSDSAWLVTAGIRYAPEMRKWMHQFDHILSRQIAELDVFFTPDFQTLVETRFDAERGSVFLEAFEGQSQRFEFEANELLLQGAGWSFPELNKEGISFQWATAPEAELGLPVTSKRDRMIRFRVLPFSYPGASIQTVEFVLNSEVLGSVELDKGWSEHEVLAPASSWRGGPDILTLRFGRTNSPAQVNPGSSDRRFLSAAFDYLEVVDGDER